MQGFGRGVKIISQENKNDDLGFVFFIILLHWLSLWIF